MVRASSTAVNPMYQSVPPRPLSYTFSDVLHASLETGTQASGGGGGGGSTGVARKVRSKTAPVSAGAAANQNAAEEYAERFRARPTTRPAVIDFNGRGVKMYTGTVGGGRRTPLHPNNHPGHFPALRARNVPPVCLARPRSPPPATASSKPLPQPLTERGTATTSSLHLAPLAKGTEPNSALSLQTKPYRPPPLPLHSTIPKPSKTPDLSRPQGGQSAASSVKSRGKSCGSHSQDRAQGGDKPKAVSSSLRHSGHWGGWCVGGAEQQQAVHSGCYGLCYVPPGGRGPHGFPRRPGPQ
ncbi:uncharacterized protein LOC143284525 [Babylonia areolata]|uniref:uncharacterized protein LOC143284525 n=1 Tax=Babylonia areolata TaxID=304850 RepID=UPI003FCFE416